MEATDNSNAAALQDALHLHQQGLLDDAERIYRKLLGSQPDNPAVLHFLGVLCHQKGNVAEAIACFEKSLTQNPNATDTHFNLGVALHQQGKFEEAVDAYRQSIALEPVNVGPYYNLGNALQELERFEEAAGAYETFLEREPENVAARYNLGLAHMHAHHYEAAIAAYRAALKIRPDFLEAWTNLGTTLLETGQAKAALDAYDYVCKHAPEMAEAHYNKGNALNALDRTGEALAAYERALEFRPDYTEARSNLGRTLMELGRLAEAETVFRDTLRQRPNFGVTYLRLANLKRFSANDPDIAAMEAELVKLPASDAQVVPFCFALGKAYEDCEDYDRAFDHYARGNDRKRATITFDIAEEEATTNQIIEAFNKAFLEGRVDKGSANETSIFIIGMPRSGTTLVEQILASHSEVYGAGERLELLRLVQEIGQFPEAIRDLGPDEFTRLGETYSEAMGKLAPEAARITDKLPHNFRHVGLIHLALPKAKILHCVRNPVDTCLSCYKNLFDGELNFTYDLDELGRYYKLYERLMNHWRAVLPGRMLDVSYEELVANQESLSRQILDFCELPWEAACLDFHKTDRRVQTASVAQVRQPIYTKAVRRWRNYEHRITPLLEALA